MDFCPKCGSIMLPKPGKKTKSFSCGCGYRTKQKLGAVIKETVKMDKKDEIEVVDKKVDTLPKTEEECPKCGNNTAYYWTVQTRAGDESETRFLECTKCKNRWRSYN